MQKFCLEPTRSNILNPHHRRAAVTWPNTHRSAEVCLYGLYRTWRKRRKKHHRDLLWSSEYLKSHHVWWALDRPVEVGGLRLVDMLALLSDGGCRVGAAVTLRGLQRVVMALQFNGTLGQRRVTCARYFPVAVWPRGVTLVWVETFAGFLWGRHIGHLGVWDAGLPQDLFWVGQVHLLHVVDGYGSVEGLLWTERGGS